MTDAPPDALTTATAAVGVVSRLLAGREGRGRWWELALLAAMAGVVGVGVQPPPLGLLQPVLEAPELRAALAEVVGPFVLLFGALALLLLLMAPVARAFTLAFIHGVETGEPKSGDWRRFLGPGARHFVWSTALTLPLYALLFGGEWLVAGEGWRRLQDASEVELIGILLVTLGKFLLVLLPWMVLTLPAMVLMYELTPAAMVAEGTGPVGGCRRVLTAARKRPGPFALYLGLRLAMQFLGTTLASLALMPCLLLSLVPGLPLLGVGYALSSALGGLSTGAGAAVLTVAVLLYLVILYCLICAALVPLSAFLFAWAARALGVRR